MTLNKNTGLIKKNKNLSTNQKIISIGLLFIFLISLSIYFIVAPSIKNINDLKKTIIAQKIELEKNIKQEKNLNQLNDMLKKIEPQLKKFNQVFINKNRELELITTLESIAHQNNVKQKIDLALNEEEDTQTYQKMKMSIKLSGDFQSTMNYLKDLETLKYYININSIEISTNNLQAKNFNKTQDNKNLEEINLILKADTFWK